MFNVSQYYFVSDVAFRALFGYFCFYFLQKSSNVVALVGLENSYSSVHVPVHCGGSALQRPSKLHTNSRLPLVSLKPSRHLYLTTDPAIVPGSEVISVCCGFVRFRQWIPGTYMQHSRYMQETFIATLIVYVHQNTVLTNQLYLLD